MQCDNSEKLSQPRLPQHALRALSPWHLAGRAFALGMRFLPVPCRYPVARAIARVMEPVIVRTQVAQDQLRRRFDGVQEVALYLVLRALAQEGVKFNASLRIDGDLQLTEAATSGRGLLLVGAHAMLTSLVVRTLYPLGIEPLIVAADPEERMSGENKRPRCVQPSPHFLLTVRSELLYGGTVCALIDQEQPSSHRTLTISTASGPVFVADALIRVACRSGARILFMTAQFNDAGQLLGTVKTATEAAQPEQVTAEFAEFLKGHLEQRCNKRRSVRSGLVFSASEWLNRRLLSFR